MTGGSGYVGEAVQRALTAHGHEVLVIARRPKAYTDGVRLVAGDLATMDLARAFDGADAVVHLVGIIRETSSATFEAVHEGLVQRVVQAMQKASVPRLVHMSALGTRARARSRYHRSKWRGEEVVRAAPVAFTILRPSLMFGGPAPFFEMLARLARLPVVPVPGDGETLFQPVYRDDVAAMVAAALADAATHGQTFELGGPRRYTLNQLYGVMARREGRAAPNLLHVPLPWVRGLVQLGQRLPLPLTEDQLLMLSEPNVTDDTRWTAWVHPLTSLE